MQKWLKDFFNFGFVVLVVIPCTILAVLYAKSGDWRAFAWQLFMLLILGGVNHLTIELQNLRKKYIEVLDDLYEEIQVNLALIEYVKELTPNNNNKTKNGDEKR